MVTATLHSFFFNPDVESHFLVRNNYITYGIVTSYVLFIKVLGPILMRKRQPMDLRFIIILFNTFLVICNAYISFRSFVALWLLWPQRCGFQNSSVVKAQMTQTKIVAWWIILVKFLELFDTVFFVLRKKYSQITFLHLFHHAVVCVVCWLALRRKSIEYCLIFGAGINCFVHVIMYSYYALAAVGPPLRKYLWWKQYLTTIQIVQFLVVLTCMAISSLTGCEQFGFFEKATFIFISLVLALFLNFYAKAYKKN